MPATICEGRRADPCWPRTARWVTGRRPEGLRLGQICLRIRPRSTFWPAFQIPVRSPGRFFRDTHCDQVVRYRARFARGTLVMEAKIMATGTVKWFDPAK